MSDRPVPTPADPHHRQPVILEGVPAQRFADAVNHLADVHRECQLVLLSKLQGLDVDPILAELAAGLVPDIEEIGDAFDAAQVRDLDDGSTQVIGHLEVGQVSTVAHLQMQLAQLSLLGRRHSLIPAPTPEIEEVLSWLWDEISGQLHGRGVRAYRHGS